MYPVGQILKYSLCRGRFGARRASIGTQVIEHLVEHQKGGACRDHDKEQSENENDRTIATGVRSMRTVGSKFAIQNLHELFWRWLVGLDFFHGSYRIIHVWR